MRISLNWLKKYVKVGISDEELVRLIGARLVEVEGVTDESTKYNNIYIVKVVSAVKIPDTHLTLCQIDVGDIEVSKVEKNEDGLVQVVCGAPNVREGMLSVWIAPGAVVPASVHEDSPFVIGKRKMLGKYESNGMLAGADELDFGDDHSGIVEIEPGTAEPGMTLAEVFELDDKILEIENKSLTHRPDCFGMIGFAREVAGCLSMPFDYEYNETSLKPEKEVEIEILDKEICARYSAVVLTKHGEDKKKYLTWMDTILAKSGMRPVDKIVDVTNYLMLLTGQPLHAFDYDKFVAVGGEEGAHVVVRLAREGEKLVLLDGKEVELLPQDIVICSGKTPVALAGAMGGASTEIDAETRNVMIESATFSLYNLRKTQMAHGIFSEAITRFTKGQPEFQTLEVGEAAAKMLARGFKVVTVADKREVREREITVDVSAEEINGLLGTDYPLEKIITTLSNVGFMTTVMRGEAGKICVTVPKWRTDIHIKEDVIEEVGRLLGYDNIEPVTLRHGTAEPDKMLAFKKRTREILSKYGANEVLTYSFVSGKLLEKAGLDTANSYRIVNSISPELQYIRQSLMPSLLDKAHMNQKLPVDKFAIFEMNKVYRKEWGLDGEGVPGEKRSLALVVAERKGVGAAYYKAKVLAERFLAENNISVQFLPIKGKKAETLPFESKRAAEIVTENGVVLGVVGEFKNSVRRNFKLAEFAAGFELDFEAVLERVSRTKEVKVVLERVKRDLTVKWNKTYGELLWEIRKVLVAKKLTAEISPLAIYQPGRDKYISVHLEFDEKIDDGVMELLEKIGEK